MKWAAGLYAVFILAMGVYSAPEVLSRQVILNQFHGYDTPAPPVLARTEPLTPAEFQYRGDGGRSGGTPEVLGLNLVSPWQGPAINTGVHGASKSSPALDHEAVYVGSDGGTMFKVSLTSGHVLWRYVTGERGGIHSSPALDKTSVYFGAYNGRFYRLAKASGEPIWSVHVGGAVGASPLIAGERVFVSVETAWPKNGYLVALERLTGEAVWRSVFLGEQLHSSPALCEPGIVVAGVNNATVVGLDSLSGALLWRESLSGAVKGTPMVNGRFVYVADTAGWVTALDCRTGRPAWRRSIGSRSISSATLLPEERQLVVGGVSGVLHWLSLDNGAILGRLDLKQYQYRSSAALSGDFLWTACDQEFVCAIHRRSRTVQRRFAVKGMVSSTPAIAHGHICISPDFPGRLHCFRAR